jgi:hypothetical protein
MPTMIQDFVTKEKETNTFNQNDVDLYSANLNQAINIGKQERLNEFGFATTLAYLYQQEGYTPKDSSDMDVDYGLNIAVNRLQTALGDTLIAKQDTSSFTNLVNGYSKSGHYKVGDTINVEDLGALFDYEYDLAGYGVDYQRFIPTDIDS